MFKLILHLFAITTTLTLTTFGITTQQEIEDWICKMAGYITVIQQNTYGCPRYIECYSDTSLSLTLETPPPIPQKSENNFLKYSREANEAECQIAGINNLRIIDFDSIINGFNPELKAYAIKLSQKDTFLQEELDKWIQNREIFVCLLIKQHTTEYGIMDIYHYYKISEEAANKYKKDLKQVFQELCRHNISKQVTILTLCMDFFSKMPLKFIINTNDEPFPFSEYQADRHAIISTDSILEEKASLLLYHELNHMIHEQLDFCGYEFFSGMDDTQIWTNLDGTFERNLFSLQDFHDGLEEETEITKAMHFEIFCGSLITAEQNEKIKINVHQTLDYAQLEKNWSTPEEMFNIIGFIKVYDTIYVNRLSDLDIQKTTRWGHFYNEIRLGTILPIEQTDFTKTIEKIHAQKEASHPKASHWDIWCKLHNRSNVEYICTNTMEDLEKFSSSLDFKD